MKYFPPFRFDERAATLYRAGVTVALSRKAAGLLQCLLASPGRLVTHPHIMEFVWPDTHVQPENIKSLVHELRAALGDQSEAPQFIRSEPGRGYTFIADVADAMPPLFASGRERSHGSVLVAREAELSLMRLHYDAAAETSIAQFVMVEGERGVGKTTLCDEFARQMRGRAVVHVTYATGFELWGPVEPYAVLIDAFTLLARQYPQLVSRAFRQHAPTWLSRFPNWLDQPAGADEPRSAGASDERLLRELGAVFDELTRDVPLLLILEDLQWSDAGTIDFLKFLARAYVPGRVFVLGSYCRSHHSPTVEVLERLGRELAAVPSCDLVRLAPLTEPELRDCLERRFGQTVARIATKPLFKAGGGNPFLAIMTMDALARSGAIRQVAGAWEAALPVTDIDALISTGLTEGIQIQIDRLSPDEHLILEAAARLGQEFTSEAVADALGVQAPVVTRPLTELAARHVLVEPLGGRRRLDGPYTRFRFRHMLASSLLTDGASLPSRAPD